MKSLKFLFLVFISSLAYAGTFYHVDLPDAESAQGKKLVLNGMGLREVTILGLDVDVYVGGLYLEKKSTDAKEIINSTDLKIIKMKFLRDVSGGKSKNAWQETFNDVCKKPKDNQKLVDACTSLKPEFDKFKNLMVDIKNDETVSYVVSPKGVVIDVDGRPLGKFDSVNASRFFMEAYIGQKPIGETLRDRMLGLKK